MNQQVEELKAWVQKLVRKKEYLAGKLDLEDKIKKDITPFYDQACKIHKQIHHSLVILTDEI